ncbi:putative O-methyltransferase YrrM [Desulfitobacterium sp. LBE]|uniref:tRNA 5-hydroxyuridine methyltransferase n=4 Tax=root TaxID=1 RepID=A0A098B4Q9_DESHA|nr:MULTISPECIES: O-methyltransferase [Desulfitobacterium]ACL22396.1 O-methyltransferase family 3 [Desulfitobacterium hafniense DCB-2]EHL04151.1 O-methyltransferase [Desulfitobacterium hafniense DP7]KTE92219.1 methyltransferase [Desulfitobacterium hafniense]MEA5023943.1 O-methyltransferase [Desulfitobacterium hafniense]TWH59821.1 putative O-methyltransferase YrrM [Desulfitobacterium sp. LBE]
MSQSTGAEEGVNVFYSFELEQYLGELLPRRDDLFLEMEEQALRETIPVVTPPVGNYLSWLVKVSGASRILEVGTAIGYSTLWLAKGLAGRAGKIVTLDLNVDRATRAIEYFKRGGVAEKIQVVMGDARRILPDFPRGEFDFIFVDAAKGEYLDYLELVTPLLGDGGIMVVDNVLFRGWVVPGSEYEPKYERMVSRLREFLKLLTENPELQTSILPLGDGLAVSIRKCS